MSRVVLGCHVLIAAWLVAVAATSDRSPVGRVLLAGVAVAIMAAFAWWARRPGGISRGMPNLLAGLLGATSGAGIALPSLATTGPSALVLLGDAGLVAGLLLIGIGTATAVRATRGRWRLLAFPVAFVVLQLGALPLAGAFYGTHPPRTPTGAARPAAASEVVVTTADGVELIAWYTPSRNGAAVIVLPGSGGAKGSTIDHAAVLARHGYGVLALDSRGTGDSRGIGNAWGWHGTADIAGALDWLTAQAEVDAGRIAALGLSMGAEEALTAAATDRRLAAVIAEGASGRTAADLAYLPMDVLGVIQRLEAVAMYGVAELLTDADAPMPLREAVATGAGVPILLIVCDAADEIGAAPLLQAASGSVDRWDVPDAPHIGALAAQPAAWEARVSRFLDATVGARAGGGADGRT